MSSITAVAANPHSSQSGDKELNCGKSACDCLTEGITLHESTWLAGRHPQSLYWYNSLSSWTAARLNHATSPTEGIKTAVLIFKSSNCVCRNVVFIGEIASIDVSPLLFTGVSSLSVEAVLFCVRWINVIQASFIHSHISRVLKSGTIADISNNPSNREHSQNFDFFGVSLKVMNKYSSCNVNRIFLPSYLVFSNVLKTLTQKYYL